MICELRFVLLDVGQRAVEPLLFPSEEHETNRAPRLHSRTDDRISRSQHAGRARSVVRAPFGEIPGIDGRAHHKNLLGIFPTPTFPYHVAAFHPPIPSWVFT